MTWACPVCGTEVTPSMARLLDCAVSLGEAMREHGGSDAPPVPVLRAMLEACWEFSKGERPEDVQTPEVIAMHELVRAALAFVEAMWDRDGPEGIDVSTAALVRAGVALRAARSR